MILFISRANCFFSWPFVISGPAQMQNLEGDNHVEQKKSIIIKLNFLSEQTVGQIKKIVGLTHAKYLVPVIDGLDLDANPRSSKTGPVTDAIEDSIVYDDDLFPFKTKGILLACSDYEVLERNRIRLFPQNREIEGILDGGHNTLAIGLYILKSAMDYAGASLPRGAITWDEFKRHWKANRAIVNDYLEALSDDSGNKSLDFLVPIELLVPYDASDIGCVESFKNDLLEICAARNNNVQLQLSAKANQLGYFDELKNLFDMYNTDLSNRVEWKTNDGGDIKAQDIIALTWIPLSLITPVRDEHSKPIEPISANSLYSRKGACLKQFEKLMSSSDVTVETNSDYKRELKNAEVLSAFKVTVDIPELYDYIFEEFPRLYNGAGGSYGRISAVKALNETRREKHAPFSGKPIETISPDGFIMPLVYGLQALMEQRKVNGNYEIVWRCSPRLFLEKNLQKIVKYYSGIFSMCDYDPQKVGKNSQSYEQALAGFKMAIAKIL